MLYACLPDRFTYHLLSTVAAILLSLVVLHAQVVSGIANDLPVLDSPAVASGGSLKLLTWNLHLLPAVAITKNQKARARGIANVLRDSQYDVIVFQEAFHNRARSIIWNELSVNYPYQYGPRKGGFVKYSSGVWIVSKLELQKKQHLGFSKCSSGTADCRARKGALLVQVEKDGIKFQIIGTHLQSKEGSKYQDVRISQLEELQGLLIAENKEESVPFIVSGDLNIAMSMTTDYQHMLTILDVENGELSGDYRFTADRKTNDMYPSNEAKGKVLDYILINSMGVEIEQVNRAVMRFRTRWHKKNRDLSDHYAVEAEIVY